MTNEQAKKMLKAKVECLKREISGTDFNCIRFNCDECSLCYEQGNMGDQKEALDMAIKALDGIPLEWIDKHLEWLDNCDNDFAQLAKVSIKSMVELWEKDRI